MAKPTPAEEAAALRLRLRLLVAEVAAGSADAVAFEETAAALAALRETELGTRKDNGAVAAERKASSETAVPEQFLCPISSEIMRDPVVLASGQVTLPPWLALG
jgi:hypothetical protein